MNINDEAVSEKYSFFLHKISKERRERIDKYCFYADKLRSLYGEVILRLVIKQRLGLKDEEIKFGYNPFGKPYLLNVKKFDFNLSHSGDWVVCAIGTNAIGIDIELVQQNFESVARRCFTINEYRWLMSRNGMDRANCFCELWTLKESYIKCIGRGLSMPLNTFEFTMNHEIITLKLNQQNNQFKCFKHIPNYRISVCSYKEDINENIHTVIL